MVADHDGGGADEGGVDGGEEVVTADEGVAAGEAGSGLAGGAAKEDVVEVGEGLGGAEAAGGGEDEGEVGAVLGRAQPARCLARFSRSRTSKMLAESAEAAER